MPRKPKAKKTMAGYFRQLFADHPEWINQRSNREVMDSYRRDHGLPEGADVGKSVQNTLSNLKGKLRRGQRKKSRKAKGVAAAGSPANGRGRIKSMSVGARMEKLEEMIDNCLSVARSFMDETLHDVVRHLHTARNKVVWMNGEPG